jgi:protein-S-isoprenylcysteine O-methyltransferase Ste14
MFLNMQYIILTVLWLSFFLAHSILASLKVKEALCNSTGLSPRQYRFLYVVFSTVHLLAIMVYSAAAQAVYIIESTPAVRVAGLVIAGVGVVIVMRAFRSYDGRAFFGLADLERENMFRRDGLLRYVRHPLYSGSIVLLIGFLLYIPTTVNTISVGLMIVYFLIGIRFEEKKMVKHFGETYERYREETPMLIPRIFR